MKSFISFFCLLSLALMMACSHTENSRRHELNELTSEQMDELNRKALVLASERLGQLVEQARTNEAAKRFLATDLFLKANMSLMEGDYVTASVLFKHVADLAPEDDFVGKKYAISLIRVGDLEAAEKVLEKLYTSSREEKVALILAGVYSGLDKEDKARYVYTKILKKNPRNEDACIFLSKSYALGNEKSKAVQQLNECSKHDPRNGMYDYYLGKIYLDEKKNTEAVEAFKRSYQRQPLTQAVNALGAYYEEKERYNDAISLYERHLKKKPQDGAILTRIVQALFVRERYQEVIPYAERLSDLEPDNLNLKVKLGILYTDAKKYPEALNIFRDLLQSAPESDKILYYLGAIHQELNEYQESIEYFNRIPVSSPLYTDSSIQMANMLSTLAQDEATRATGSKWQQSFTKFIDAKIAEFADFKVEFSVIKAGYYEALSQYKEAMECLLTVKDEKSFSTQHKYYLANLLEKEKRFEESTALIMGIIEKEPKNAHAWNFLGYSLLVRGEEMDKAYQYIKTAVQIDPQDGYIRDSLGWYYYKKGDIKKALSELNLAVKKEPNDIEILKHLAEIYREMKNLPKARSYFQTALKHAKFHSERQEILSLLEDLEGERVPASGALD